jgi:hypothetical protein
MRRRSKFKMQKWNHPCAPLSAACWTWPDSEPGASLPVVPNPSAELTVNDTLSFQIPARPEYGPDPVCEWGSLHQYV